jgi:hypothetical protein
VLNALIAPEGAHPSNPDGVGCGQYGAKLTAAGDGWPEGLGDASDFIDLEAGSLNSCVGDAFKQPAPKLPAVLLE